MIVYLFSHLFIFAFYALRTKSVQNYKKKFIYARTKCMPRVFFCQFGSFWGAYLLI